MAKALEVYEGLDSAILDTEGLGEKINKALAARIDQLKTLNMKLDQTNNKLAISQTNLNEKGLERLRITVTPKHRKEHIENMVKCLDQVWSDLSLPRKNSTKLQANN